MPVSFYKENVRFRLSNRNRLLDVIKLIGLVEQKEIGDISVVFVSDKRLLEINRKFLDHDFFTDIITFQYSAGTSVISGDLFISIERVSENAVQLDVPFKDELSRVVIHGVLHLCGYRDKQAVEKNTMRKKEDFYLDSMKSL